MVALDDSEKILKDLAQLARLAVERNDEETRLYIARLVRRYRGKRPAVASHLSAILDHAPTSSTRQAPKVPIERRENDQADSTLSILREWPAGSVIDEPVLPPDLRLHFQSLLHERRRSDELSAQGLRPVSSAIFVGPPGVGKTQTARWISVQLGMPLFSLDLTAVMSSRLGQSGANLRYALDFARTKPSILFLDEIDSIAKRRGDQSDIGELKRLVTIMLQELDDWPSTSLVLAATNHPELVDPALWRRFDAVINFPMPNSDLVEAAVRRFLARDAELFDDFIPALVRMMDGRSFSDIERSILNVRKTVALDIASPADAAAQLVRDGVDGLSKSERIDLAADLTASSRLSQHQIARLTAVSRDTIRKRTKLTTAPSEGGRNG